MGLSCPVEIWELVWVYSGILWMDRTMRLTIPIPQLHTHQPVDSKMVS